MSATYTVPADPPAAPAALLVEIGGQTAPAAPVPPWPAAGAFAGGAGPAPPFAAPPLAAPVFCFSDAGIVFEPTDADRPNQAFDARLAEPLLLDELIPVVPEGPRRTSTVGDLSLLNGDRRMDLLGGDWRVAGQPVTLWRGPKRAPFAAPFAAFERLATLRARQAAYGTDRLRIALDSAAADLEIPLCPTYAGTGGAEGPAALAGRFKPRCYGRRDAVEPVLVNEVLGIFQVHAGAIDAVLAARVAGVLLLFTADFPTHAALAAASLAAGQYATCLAEGLIRLGGTPQGVVTADVRGDVSLGGFSATAAGIAERIARGPGGLPAGRWGAGWSAWPTGPTGFFFGSGTVAAALDRVARAVAGWWGADALGNIVAGAVRAPEGLAPSRTLERLVAPAGQLDLAPPRWRQPVEHGSRERPLTFAETVPGATDRDAQATAARLAFWADLPLQAALPGARDAEAVPANFVNGADAQALADALGLAHGAPRSLWSVALGRWEGVGLGDVVRVESPLAPRLSGRNWLVRRRRVFGERVDLSLWG